jgi:hypothetical protein
MPSKRPLREVRLALDRRAGVAGRRQATELCARYGPDAIPADMLTAAELAFKHATGRALRDSRVEGNPEVLLTNLIEVWHASFVVELGRQRRARDGAPKS